MSARWLADKAAAGEIPCTKLGRFVGWSDNDITHLLAEHAFDSRGRRRQR